MSASVDWQKIKGFDYLRKALLISIPIALGLLFYLISINATGLIFSNSFICLISIPTFIANLLASGAYFGRLADIASGRSKASNEFIGTMFGVAAGLIIAIALIQLQFAIPFAGLLAGFENVLFVLWRINIFAGLGNRIGRSFDAGEGSRPYNEKIIAASLVIVGTILGAALFITQSAALIPIGGIITLFTGTGIAMPVFFKGLIFTASVASLLGSAGDYIAKSINYILNKPDHLALLNPTLAQKIERFLHDRKHEYRGSLVGMCIGISAGLFVIHCLAASGLASVVVFAGIIGLITKGLILATAASVYASPCSRVGRIIDAIDTPTPLPNPEKQAKLIPGKFKLLASSDPKASKPIGTVKKAKESNIQQLSLFRPIIPYGANPLPTRKQSNTRQRGCR